MLSRSALALCVMTFVFAVNAPAHANWRVVQWFYGDCKIWFDKRIPPFGGGWRSLTGPIPDYRAARHVLQGFYDRRVVNGRI